MRTAGEDKEVTDLLRTYDSTVKRLAELGVNVQLRDRANEDPGPPPVPFLFGFDDPFDDGGLYVWIVGEPFYRETGYLDDSSSASSVVTESQRNSDELSEGSMDSLREQASFWLDKATAGILYGEGMESCWDSGWVTEYDREMHKRLTPDRLLNDPYEGKTREQAIEEIKAKLTERGFRHEPKLDRDDDA